MHVYFINYHYFQDSSGIHIHFLANALEELGVRCTVCMPSKPESARSFGAASYESVSFGELRWRVLLKPKVFGKDTLIHSWTPRESVRRMTEFVVRRTHVPYFVHLEDNEAQIFESHMGLSVAAAEELPWYRRLRYPRGLIHPARYGNFVARASGVTCIMEPLEQFVPGQVPAMTFWPACEAGFFQLPLKPDGEMRKRLSIPNVAAVLTYTGNVHVSNLEEVETLYEAVVALNEGGRLLYLLRCGSTHAQFSSSVLKRSEPYVIDLGSRPPGELIKYIAAADILVQPGRSDPFNDFRFPSKIPMFLASGRPVIMPDTNIGKHMTHGENCHLLRDGSVCELVDALTTLLDKKEYARRLGVAGRQFAHERLDWKKSAIRVLKFYEKNSGIPE